METLFVADVHWQPAGPDNEDPTGPFGRFLDELAARARAGSPSHLYVLGDLFDYWLERRGQIFSCYEPHVELLRRTSEAGVAISLLYGNRDFAYGPALPERTGVEVSGDRVEIELGGKRLLLQHGDLLCTRDWRYQLYRRVIRSWLARTVIRLVPVRWLTRMIEAMRRASHAEIGRKDRRALSIVDAAVAAELAKGFDVVICGHVHRAERRPVEAVRAGTELLVLGPWDRESGWYASFNGTDFELNTYRVA